ncbi:PREDICTED: thrombin inhibitor rhodniin-like [Ceratosolen solmsi marchali]|uniref:Thrombin inhibitor rhodniin-like n=1 Tax=Ceratosolen solmsi marchali TaxID=326594 RepID=A0AAJ6YG47_9HYME|nr:PREDICTED: thrombin inhibitor rhodniin-like [Ceratosolen solmsi marchali]
MIKLSLFLALVVLLSISFQVEAVRLDEGTTDCLCPVTADIFYVCGSNGSTYTNPTSLRCAAFCTGRRITKSYDGWCRS